MFGKAKDCLSQSGTYCGEKNECNRFLLYKFENSISWYDAASMHSTPPKPLFTWLDYWIVLGHSFNISVTVKRI